MRGRKPRPTARKRLENFPGHRPPNKAEPELPPATVASDAAPDELEGDTKALAEWARSAPMLRESRVLTEGDRGALIALCQQWSLYHEASQKWRKTGMLVKTGKGIPSINPYIKLADHALSQCIRLWAELGLTPSSRSRISVLEAKAPPVSSPLAKLQAQAATMRRPVGV